MTPRTRVALLVAGIGTACAVIAFALFPRAFPAIALDNRLTQASALARADSFFAAHTLAPKATRRAVRFSADDSVLTYVDLAAGGTDSVNALVRGRDHALFTWTVRAFAPGDVHEAAATFATDGRVIGFRRKLANADTLPDVGADSATALARTVLTRWLVEPEGRWMVRTTSYETRKESGRVDRTVTFERTDRRIGDAPLRLDVVIAGNTPVEARPYLYVPESFTRRYAEMRSANDLLATLATLGILGLGLVGVAALRRFSRTSALRWKPAVLVGGVVGAGIAGAGINGLGAAWFGYDTAMPAGLYRAITIAAALAGGVAAGGIVTLTLAAAEAAARHAFPHKLDWWALWRARGTREVAAQVGGGYVVAAIGFAYVAAFYVVTRGALGWWVPSELLDDPNQIATPAPWLAGIALSLQAGVWEEALFRALPLSMLSLWAMHRPNRDWWMRLGVVGTALIFGFAHSNYPSWPPYSRGFELLLEASFWGVLFLRTGLLVTVLAHFTFDLVLFSLFTATGNAPEYRISAAIAMLALLAPALVVAWRVVRQRGFVPLPEGARFGEWRPAPPPPPGPPPEPVSPVGAMSRGARTLAWAACGAALIAAVAVPEPKLRGPAFTTTRDQAIAAADRVLRARADSSARRILEAVDTPGSGWRRLATTARDTLTSWPRFLHAHGLDSLAAPLAATYAIPAWWAVRYVRTTGTATERAEEWRVRVLPDGSPLDARHIVSDSAPGASPPADSVRRAARRALAAAGLDTTHFVESDLTTTDRPRRRDATVAYVDTTVHLPAGASARAWVSFAGNEVLVVRRGVELPEAFQRAERERRTRVVAFAALFAALLLGVAGGGAIVVSRRRPALVHDRMFERRTSVTLLGIFAALAMASALNGWPATLFSYDTASSWSNHVATVVVGIIVSPILALVLAGLWLVMEAMRRRAGIAAWPARDAAAGGAAAAAGAVGDATLAGAALGAVAALGAILSWVIRAEPAGQMPVTQLDAAVPVLSTALGVPLAIAMDVATAAIPVLLVLAATRDIRRRWLIVALAAVVSAGVLAPVAGSVSTSPLTAAGVLSGLAAVAALVAALVTWGRRGPYAWLLAAAALAGYGALRVAVHAPVGVERAGGLLGMLVCAGAAWWLHRRACAR